MARKGSSWTFPIKHVGSSGLCGFASVWLFILLAVGTVSAQSERSENEADVQTSSNKVFSLALEDDASTGRIVDLSGQKIPNYVREAIFARLPIFEEASLFEFRDAKTSASDEVQLVVTKFIEPLNIQISDTTGIANEADLQDFRYRSSGKLLVKKGATWESCSAQFISPDLLITAAHCLQDQGDESIPGGIRFLHRFKEELNSNITAVEYASDCFAINSLWHQLEPREALKWDVALVYLPGANSQEHLGLMAGIPKPSFESTGYPRNHYAGRILLRLHGAADQTSDGIYSMTNNDPRNGGFLFGASGGAWVTSEGIMVGLNSAQVRKIDGSYGMHSPIFGDEFLALLDDVGRCRANK